MVNLTELLLAVSLILGFLAILRQTNRRAPRH